MPDTDAAAYAASWRARLHGGRCAINATHRLDPNRIAPEINGCDGQEIGALLMEGYPGNDLDGGDLETNVVATPYAPQRGDGGLIG